MKKKAVSQRWHDGRFDDTAVVLVLVQRYRVSVFHIFHFHISDRYSQE